MIDQPPAVEPSDGPEAITIQTADGRTLYWPPDNVARLAPAAICAVAARTVELRRLLPELRTLLETRPDHLLAALAHLETKLVRLAAPLPFEPQLLFGRIAQVHGAIEAIGQKALPPENPRVVLEISGGVLHNAYATDGDLTVEMWDFDSLGGDGAGIDEDVLNEQYAERLGGTLPVDITVPNLEELRQKQSIKTNS